MCWEAGRGMCPQEQQFVVVLCEMQQQTGVSPPPWQVWGGRGAPNPLCGSGMLMQGCTPTDHGIILNSLTSGKGES